MSKTSVVTGAFSYTGRYITQILQQRGEQVINLTNHPNRPMPQNQIDKSKVKTYPLCYDDVDQLSRQIEGADTLYLSYWQRFNDFKGEKRSQSLERAQNIVQAAKNTQIKKIVYLSHIGTEDPNQSVTYVKSKAIVENTIKESGISYGIAKPCVVFGDSPQESLVINNMAWVLRYSPIFLQIGSGFNPIQPVHVRDYAELCVNLADSKENLERDAVGPEVFLFKNFIKEVKSAVNSKSIVIPGLSSDMVYYGTLPLDYFTKDKFIERDDMDILTQNYCYSKYPPTGKRSLSQWLKENGETLGKQYISHAALYYEPEGSQIFNNFSRKAN